jgi:hypothetical protein
VPERAPSGNITPKYLKFTSVLLADFLSQITAKPTKMQERSVGASLCCRLTVQIQQQLYIHIHTIYPAIPVNLKYLPQCPRNHSTTGVNMAHRFLHLPEYKMIILDHFIM